MKQSWSGLSLKCFVIYFFVVLMYTGLIENASVKHNNYGALITRLRLSAFKKRPLF